MEKKDKKYTLKVKGKEIEVSEEIYRAYIRPVQAEQRQKRRVRRQCAFRPRQRTERLRTSGICCRQQLHSKNAH